MERSIPCDAGACTCQKPRTTHSCQRGQPNRQAYCVAFAIAALEYALYARPIIDRSATTGFGGAWILWNSAPSAGWAGSAASGCLTRREQSPAKSEELHSPRQEAPIMISIQQPSDKRHPGEALSQCICICLVAKSEFPLQCIGSTSAASGAAVVRTHHKLSFLRL